MPELSSGTPVAHPPSFWTHVPTLLKAVAGLVTAVAGLLGALYQFDVLSPTDEPRLSLPVTQVATTKPAPAGPDTVALRSYVDDLDLLLANSRRTRGDLNQVITGVQQGTMSRGVAVSTVEDVIDDRRSLLDEITTRQTPDEFRGARRLLREALALSIEVDRFALAFVEASFAGNSAAAADALREVGARSATTTARKGEFVRVYNAVRAKFDLEAFSGTF